MSSTGLSGNLRTMPVPDLLQSLAGGQATGTLVVGNGVLERQVCFRNGQIIAAGSSDPRDSSSATGSSPISSSPPQ
jgi:hypothetical protein